MFLSKIRPNLIKPVEQSIFKFWNNPDNKNSLVKDIKIILFFFTLIFL